MSAATLSKPGPQIVPSYDWRDTKGYMIHVQFTKEEDGTFTAVALNLPGAASSGVTQDDAKSNIKEAVCQLIESYREVGEQVPWRDSSKDKIPFGAEQTRLYVDA
jgi:predicted RNase H-like HicB family nuclease